MLFTATLKNTGLASARNIYGFHKEVSYTDIRGLVKEKDSWTTAVYIGSLRPNDEELFSIEIPWQRDKQGSTLAILFKYDYFDQKDEVLTLIAIIAGSTDLSNKWFEYEDIKKAQEPLRGI